MRLSDRLTRLESASPKQGDYGPDEIWLVTPDESIPAVLLWSREHEKEATPCPQH